MQRELCVFVRRAVDDVRWNQQRIPRLHPKNPAIDCDDTASSQEYDRFFGIVGMRRMRGAWFQPSAKKRHVSGSSRSIDEFDREQTGFVLHDSRRGF